MHPPKNQGLLRLGIWGTGPSGPSRMSRSSDASTIADSYKWLLSSWNVYILILEAMMVMLIYLD